MSITLNGTIPPSEPVTPVVIIQANGESGPGGPLKFLFSAPAPTPGGYVLSFCIGPAENPFGSPTSYIVNVPASQGQLAVVDAGIFKNNVLVVSQGTRDTIPFSVTIE
jgi:hypothetical protein